MVKVIGLTGSIAVGKSTVTHYLKNKGYVVLDADEISHHALDQGTSCYQKVIKLFGCMDKEGNIDRKQLGNIVFQDQAKKKQLEDIIHPYVIDELKRGIQSCQDKLIFLDVPLLYEVHLEKLCDKVIVVYVDEMTQKERLMKRNSISGERAEMLMKQQISIEEKRKIADYVIDNRNTLKELYINIERVLEVIKNEVIYE